VPAYFYSATGGDRRQVFTCIQQQGETDVRCLLLFSNRGRPTTGACLLLFSNRGRPTYVRCAFLFKFYFRCFQNTRMRTRHAHGKLLFYKYTVYTCTSRSRTDRMSCKTSGDILSDTSLTSSLTSTEPSPFAFVCRTHTV